jgi:hypothetical protein
MNVKPDELPVLEINPTYLLEAARFGRLLIMDLDGPKAPYPIYRVRLVTYEAGSPSLAQTPDYASGSQP